METVGDIIAGLGDNRPPPIEVLRDELEAENEPLLRRKDELLGAVARVPAIESDDVAGRVADLVKMITACAKNTDAARVARKEPFLEGGRAVDGYFKARILDPLDKAKKGVEAKLGVYLRSKADRERRAREEADRAARQAAQDAADQAAKAAEAMRTEKDLDKAMDLARQAEEATAQAAAATKAATAKPAEMSRTRGDAGALGSLRTFFDFDPLTLNRAELDLEALRQHLPTDALDKAIRSFIRAGGRDLRGVRIYERQEARVS